MTSRPEHLPERLALISDVQAAEYISRGLLEGRDDVPSIALNKVAEPLPGEGARLGLHRVRDLIDQALERFRDERPTAADAWLAPRLHETLRLTRREAADKRLWTYLALGVAPDYVMWRHLSEAKADGSHGRVARDRFVGPHYKQTFARLWWAAELFRDGPDYQPVVVACGNQDMLNSALRLDVIDHRPTALALVRMMERGTVRTGREVNALTPAVNAAAATLMYDIIAPDVGRDGDALRDWIAAAESSLPSPRNHLPEGPEEERAPEEAVGRLVDHFEELFADAQVRGRASGEGE
ncbi:DUF6339 family protein [Streptomyces rapamycinicus]|uniref:Uncharacterized protein n=2 Tax=Streptomyces rapamycinicus TaxID=1226757 RepID=A0A0A0NJ53_STRRN|nr:DUF6339 family protein [Streptomyces rapamycinicus]AGP56138.1 hypothetical protein M271_23120 [Streptomyces rapamycinicus NRRL 5491]MBB4783743.1 hypothetical protein [Streptomyces rapamycinicus]RLV80786.1 hypothetical protein D3C57_120415 [Streptomyces rapamycinicus NRRL 5491]UTO64101.1 hypothetical protein LJB45_18410 [Streptomyces rapamycinicus]UTP32056.1 hypothetical protein LIV37_23530 [Streptomyces rapamycinicus NRRL 5491]